MRSAHLLATLRRLGISPSFSRPRTSNDNPYSEALFRTLKYRPSYPTRPGRHLDVLAQRKRVYEAARARHPERWTGPTRNCDPIPVVCLNPERAANHVIKQSA